MNEATFQTKFNKWLYGQWTGGTACFELKLTKTNRIRIDAVQPHQIHGLRMCSMKLAYKIPDVGLGKKPFDCFVMDNAQGFVVIGFYKQRKGITFYVIPFALWEAQTVPSLTEPECSELSILSASL